MTVCHNANTIFWKEFLCLSVLLCFLAPLLLFFSVGSILKEAEEALLLLLLLLLGGFQEDIIDVFEYLLGGLCGIDVVMNSL